MHDAAIARHRLGHDEVAILGERRGHAEAAVDVAAAAGSREGLRAQHEVGRPPTGGGVEHRRRSQVSRITLCRAGLDPACDDGDLFLREATNTDEVSVAGHRLPRGHGACPRRLANLLPAPVGLLVGDQMERPTSLRAMALLAVPLKDRSEVARERRIRGGADAPQRPDGDEHEDRQQPWHRHAQHPVILNTTRRSSASRASSVPVPTRFSRNPTPDALVREASSGASLSRRCLM